MGTCWSDVEFLGAKKSQVTQLLVWEFLILEPDAPEHDGQICFWSPEVPVHGVLPNQPASRVRGLRHLRICLQEFGDTGSMVEV